MHILSACLRLRDVGEEELRRKRELMVRMKSKVVGDEDDAVFMYLRM